MAHGGPDYGVGAPKATVYSLQDMAELAVRLGSIVSFDRRGDVVWLDDFENNVNHWGTDTSGTGASVALTTDRARNGAKSVALITGNADGEYASILVGRQLPHLGRIGLELSLSVLSRVDHWLIDLSYSDGDEVIEAALRVYPATGIIQLYTRPRRWETIHTAGAWYSSAGYWYTLKLVVDLEARTYRHLLFGPTSIDLAAYDLYVGASGVAPIIEVYIYVEGMGGGVGTGYVDDVIVTQNEP